MGVPTDCVIRYADGCSILARFLRKGGIPRKHPPRFLLLILLLPLGGAAVYRCDNGLIFGVG